MIENTLEFFSRLTTGINLVSAGDLPVVMATYHILPEKVQEIRLPVEKHISIYLKLRVARRFERIIVLKKTFIVSLGDIQMHYNSLDLAQRALPILEETFYSSMYGAHA